MKNAKKIFAVLVVLALALSIVVPAAAEEETATITISNATAGQTYTIYKMADLETYDAEKGTYSYKVAAGWKDFFTKQGIEVDVTDFILYDNDIKDTDTALSAFAVAAVEYATDEENDLSPYKSETFDPKDDDDDLTFTVVPGYYCIDSTLGTKSAVYLTTKQNFTLLEKNSIPGIIKEVLEDSTEKYGKSNDASVGDPVTFRITVKTGVGVASLTIEDVLSKGLKLNSDPKIEGENVKGKLDITEKSDSGFTATIKGHEDNKDIEIVYTAIVTPDAILSITGDENKGIDNTAKLIYGENNTFTEVKTKTFVWSFDVFKVDANNIGLPGATFSIYATEADAEAKINPLKFTGKEGEYQYDPDGTETILQSNPNGKYTIKGVDSGVYYVREIEAPTGYNKTEKVYEATVTVNTSDTSDNPYNKDTLSVTISGPKIENKTGTVLPSTGATGTALFITIGGVLVVAMFVLLIVRKRMTKLVYTK